MQRKSLSVNQVNSYDKDLDVNQQFPLSLKSFMHNFCR